MKKNKKDSVDDMSFHELDKYRLDDEWINQPKMIRYYGEKLAWAKHNLEIAKTELDVLRADLSKKVRARPGKYGIEKITEACVENELIVQLSAHPVQKKILDAKHDINMLQVAMTTLDNRKKALTDLVFLHSIQYFAEPKAPKGEAAEKAVDRIKKSRLMRRREEDDDD